MPEKVTLNEAQGIIEVSSYDAVTKQDIVNSVDTIIKINSEKGINKVLVDVRKQTAMPDTMEIVELPSKIPNNLRVAILASEKQPTKRDITFFETIAVNRYINFKIFFSEEQALAWLNE